MPILTRDDARHEYRLDGVVVPSVTQILADMKSFDGIPPAILERKRNLGTAVHAACEFDVAGELDETTLHPEVAGYLAGFREWRAMGGFRIVETESYVYHPTLRYAGQLDLIAERIARPGERWLVDIKTAATHTPIWRLQTAGYAACRPDGKSLKRGALQLLPDRQGGAGYRFFPYDAPECATDAAAWMATVMRFNWIKANLQ